MILEDLNLVALDPDLREQVLGKLRAGCSPDQVAGRLRFEHGGFSWAAAPRAARCSCSAATSAATSFMRISMPAPLTPPPCSTFGTYWIRSRTTSSERTSAQRPWTVSLWRGSDGRPRRGGLRTGKSGFVQDPSNSNPGSSRSEDEAEASL